MKPIRVLHVVTYMGRGGLETMLMNYYRHIDRERIQFDFLVHRDFEADYDKEILSLGGRIYRVPKLNPFSMAYHKALNSFFRNHPEYNIVHVHQDCLSSFALKAANKNNVPIRIAHSHSSSQDKNFKYLLKKYFMKSIPDYATNLFACGREAGNWMFGGKSYEIVRNAIDVDSFKYDINKRSELRKKFKLTDNLVVGHVGRFNYPKNHDFLIDTFKEIYLLNSNSKLFLIGAGDLEDRIREKVNDLGLSENVIFLGNRSDVNELMQAMDIFVFPSHYEGLPVTLVEAQASGLLIFKSLNVSDQCKITPNVYSLSLNDNAKHWAIQILEKYKEYHRNDTSLYIKNAGYDIKSNAIWLQEFYINEVKQFE